MRVRTQLQVTADAAAHAALYTREHATLEEAKAAAMAIVEYALPAAVNGDVVVPGDIRFGIWDAESQVFVEDVNSKSAVWIDLSRVAERSNGVATWLLRITGFEEWSIVRAAVFQTHRPPCLREGFVAEGIVDLRSNNEFYNGFCIHSNDQCGAAAEQLFRGRNRGVDARQRHDHAAGVGVRQERGACRGLA